MNPLRFLLILFLLSASVNAQQRNFTEVDKYAATLPAKYTHKVDTLAYYLTYKYNNQIDKVRSIFVWIANNISYDVYNLYKNNITEEIIKTENVLFYKRTVCEGYADLFKKLCNLSGITCIKISGGARDITYENGGTFAQKVEGHAWNIVKIDTGFFIVDPKYYKAMDEEYFLANPEKICWSHYPSNPVFQLLDTPLTYSEFFKDTIIEKPVYVNYRDSINKILTLPSSEYELATERNQNGNDKMELERIAYLYFTGAQEKCMKAKTQEEKALAIKSVDDIINFIKAKNLDDMDGYIKRCEAYKRMLSQ